LSPTATDYDGRSLLHLAAAQVLQQEKKNLLSFRAFPFKFILSFVILIRFLAIEITGPGGDGGVVD
jgi:hypothetical protein